jgi:TonB family protein
MALRNHACSKCRAPLGPAYGALICPNCGTTNQIADAQRSQDPTIVGPPSTQAAANKPNAMLVVFLLIGVLFVAGAAAALFVLKGQPDNSESNQDLPVAPQPAPIAVEPPTAPTAISSATDSYTTEIEPLDSDTIVKQLRKNGTLETSPTTGGLDASIIRKIMQNSRASFTACYEKQLAIDADLHGNVIVTFVINASGRVESVKTTTTINQAVAACVATRTRRLVFPRPSGGSVSVTYPLTFRPT